MSLTLTDAAGTPVNRTFLGVQSNPDLAVWKDLVTKGGFPVGAGVVSLSVKENANGVTRVSGKLVLPTMETVSGETDLGFSPVPTKAFECIGSFDLVFPNRSSLQNRKDLNAMFKDLLSDAVVTSAVESFVHPSA
jgi:hypothetical protein